MGIKVSKHTPIYVENMSVLLNTTNTGSTPNKKIMALSYHFVREYVAKNVVEVRKIHTSDNFSNLFTKPLVRKYFHGFCHTCIVNE